IEKRGSPRRLERCHRYALRHLGDVGTGGTGFRLTRWWRHTSPHRILIQGPYDLETVGTCRSELNFGLAERELDVWLGRERRGRKAAAFLHGLRRNLIQCTTRYAERYPDME